MIILQNKFICFQTKFFWMLHLNDHFYTKLMCLFVGSKLLGVSSQALHASYTFIGFLHWTHMYNQKYPVFHPRGYLSLLAFTQHIFSFSCMQPCDFIGHRPTIPSPPSNTKRSVDPFQLTPMSCDVPVHMQCDVPLHAYTMSHIR